MKKNVFLLAFCAAGLSLFSCEKQGGVEPNSPDAITEDVVMQNGILVFKDRKTMRAYNSKLNKEGIAYSNNWEKQMGFTSITHILDDVQKAERQLEIDLLRGKTAAELERLRQAPAPHSELYTKWINAGVLRIEKDPNDPTGAYSLQVNSSHTHYTNVMNADGMVAFGDTLYQYKGDKIKVTTKGLAEAKTLMSTVASNPSRHIIVKTSPFRFDPETSNRGINETPYNENDFGDAYEDGSKKKSVIKVSLYSEVLYDAHKQNFVDFWIEANCYKKNFWGNWVDEDAGNGIWGIEATYSWQAIVNPFWYSTTALPVPGYTPGNAYVYYVPDTHPGTIKLDYTTGAPQYGNQLFPNGTYTPYFDPSTGYNYYISQGIRLDRGSIFKCIPVNNRRVATLSWVK